MTPDAMLTLFMFSYFVFLAVSFVDRKRIYLWSYAALWVSIFLAATYGIDGQWLLAAGWGITAGITVFVVNNAIAVRQLDRELKELER